MKIAEAPNNTWRKSGVLSPVTYDGMMTNSKAATSAYHGSPPGEITSSAKIISDVNEENVVPLTFTKMTP